MISTFSELPGSSAGKVAGPAVGLHETSLGGIVDLGLRFDRAGDCVVLTATGWLDYAALPQLREHLSTALAMPPHRGVVDMSRLETDTGALDFAAVAMMASIARQVTGR